MKTKLLALLVMASTTATAATLHAPDKAFIESIAPYSLAQENWDSGASAKLLMRNSHRMTYYMDMSNKGIATQDLGKASGLDLTKLKSWDLDGEHNLEVILRDRLNQESIVITKNGKLVDEFYWNGNDKDSTHIQMSITKSFTAILVGMLADEGKIDMNKPVSVYLPELKGSGFENATVQEVADMRSGIVEPFSPGLVWDDRMSDIQEWNGVNNYPEFKSIIDWLKVLEANPHKPHGEVYEYLCSNTELLGMLVERIEGKSLADAMEERLWSKVGFEHHGLLQSNSNGEAVASGGLSSTTRDVARMMNVMINDGKNHLGQQIVPKAFIDALLEGNDEVRSAWAKGKEAKMAPDAWYKDQIRTFNVAGYKFLAFVGINGQVAIGEPSSGIVISMNGAQDEMQAPRTVMMTFFGAIPALLDAVSAK